MVTTTRNTVVHDPDSLKSFWQNTYCDGDCLPKQPAMLSVLARCGDASSRFPHSSRSCCDVVVSSPKKVLVHLQQFGKLNVDGFEVDVGGNEAFIPIYNYAVH
jgi:hypothetical protein